MLALLNRANEYGRTSNLKPAIDDYTAVLALPKITDNDKATALLSRGWFAYENGDIVALIRDSEAALDVDPMQENALFNLGLGYLLSGDGAKAKAQYERACRDAKSTEVIAASLKDLEDAIDKRGPVAGSDEILAMIRNRMANAQSG